VESAHRIFEPGDEGVVGIGEAHQGLLGDGTIVQILQSILGALQDESLYKLHNGLGVVVLKSCHRIHPI
jgi:hypothetical protein